MDYSKYVYKTASCPAFGDWAINNKLVVKWGNAKRGDIVLFDFNKNSQSDHIGIVTKVTADYIETIEGNTSSENNTNGDGVYRRKRYKSQVNYFVRTKCPNLEAVIKTAESQLGYKEGRNNSNKYGKWFGYNNVSWCCEFVVWCFYHTTEPKVIKAVPKPTTKYNGAINSAKTLKRGMNGSRVKTLQRFLKWYTGINLVIDGDFGAKTENAQKVWQKSEGIKTTGVWGETSHNHALKYLATKPSGSSTTNAKKIGDMAYKLSWSASTPKSKWHYYYSKSKKWSSWGQLGKSRPNDAFRSAYDKVFGKKHWEFGSSKYGYGGRVGASCDKFVGTVVRASGVNKSFPHTLDEMYKKTPSGFKTVDTHGKISNMKHGDIVWYKKKNGGGHTFIIVEISGKKYIAEAGLNNRFPRRKKAKNFKPSSYKKFTVWRAK